jgi:hypothetical protein
MSGSVRAAAEREVHAPLEETIENRLGEIAIMHYVAQATCASAQVSAQALVMT